MNKRSASLLAAGLASLVLLLPSVVLAGVVVTHADGSRAYLADGCFKQVDGENQTMIFDANRDVMILVDTTRKIYAEGTVDAFCESGSNLMEQAMAGLSPEEQEMMKQMMGDLPGQDKTPKRPDVRVERGGDGDSVAGYATVRYRVTADGKPYEELWLSAAPPLMEEFGRLGSMVEQTGRLAECFGGGLAAEDLVEAGPEYIALLKKGYPLKTIKFEDGRPEVQDEVVKVEETGIPASEFRPPPGYRKVSFRELMGGQQGP